MIPTIYILHAKEDAQHEASLSKQLTVFERYLKVVSVVRERDILASMVPRAEREKAIARADIVVLLVTPNVWDLYEVILLALSQFKPLVPVLVSSTPWTQAEWGGFKPVPSDEKFIEDWKSQDAAWHDVVIELRRLWESLVRAAAGAGAVTPLPPAATPSPSAQTPAPPTVPESEPPLPVRALPPPLGPEERVRVLFVAANPSASGRLELGKELAQIKERTLLAPYGRQFDFIYEPEVRVNRLAAALLTHRPHIVHFSSHGNASGAIMLVDPDRPSETRPIDARALRQLFHNVDSGLHCVVMNSCYSAVQPQQALGLADVAAAVIGMNAPVFDKSAIDFAAGFYEAIAHGCNLKAAFELGKNAISLMGNPGPDIPQLHTRAELNPETLQIFAQDPALSG